jgi:hypothetical protein
MLAAVAMAGLSARMEEVAEDLPARVDDDLQEEPRRHWAVVVDNLALGVAGEIER